MLVAVGNIRVDTRRLDRATDHRLGRRFRIEDDLTIELVEAPLDAGEEVAHRERHARVCPVYLIGLRLRDTFQRQHQNERNQRDDAPGSASPRRLPVSIRGLPARASVAVSDVECDISISFRCPSFRCATIILVLGFVIMWIGSLNAVREGLLDRGKLRAAERIPPGSTRVSPRIPAAWSSILDAASAIATSTIPHAPDSP